MFGVRGEQNVGEELLETVAGVARSVLHVGPDRLVEFHQELLGRRPQLLDHLIPLVNIFWVAMLRKKLGAGMRGEREDLTVGTAAALQ